MPKKDMESWRASSYLFGGNSDYLDDLYELYLKNPAQVSDEWRAYFRSLPAVGGAEREPSHEAIRQEFLQLVRQPRARRAVPAPAVGASKQIGVYRLVQLYRRYGHLVAHIDPLDGTRSDLRELLLEYSGLSEMDYGDRFDAYGVTGTETATLKEIVGTLRDIYCSHIGFEYFHVGHTDENHWLQGRIESAGGRATLSPAERRHLLEQLVRADGIEKYLGMKYVGQKRFSLEGGDSFIPALDEVVRRAGEHTIKEIVLTLAHRGRINTMVNILGQPFSEVARQFEGKQDFCECYGDVKYHLGYSSDVETSGGPLHLTLCFNPSHLESVNVVAMGSSKARQDRHTERAPSQVLPVIVHGDAAFAGEGIVMEGLAMSHTPAYNVCGSLHIVINNQIGYTTEASDSRSSAYCSDIAKMIDAPVFHVNGDDPEAVLFVTRLALDYRMKFQKDVVIDLVCYRRLGHNEADEPSATQPCMYQNIRKHVETWRLYSDRLVEEGVCGPQDADAMLADYRAKLDSDAPLVKKLKKGLTQKNAARWAPYVHGDCRAKVDTRVSLTRLKKLGERLNQLPKKFTLQKQIGNIMAARAEMAMGKVPMDWGHAEIMAYATILNEGFPIRMTGQDCQRGTFSHRHAVLHDHETGECFAPLAQVNPGKAFFEVDNSVLCEAGVLGFEFGYASTEPNTLVIWEAQFGDFANNAQTIIDQYIAPARHKWDRLCGLVLLLPHGYEGMGPEHSSARLERYLQLSAEDNMQVCVPTTPAQMFHLIRRQILQSVRVPLIVMTPKSLLRHKMAVSTLDELSKGHFQIVIPELDRITPKRVSRVVICSGKVYYDLLAERRERKLNNVAIIRVEQLFPFLTKPLAEQLAHYKLAKEVVWCQEEPKNQGAWFMIRDDLEQSLAPGQSLCYVGRPAMAVTAEGFSRLHHENQKRLVDEALHIKA